MINLSTYTKIMTKIVFTYRNRLRNYMKSLECIKSDHKVGKTMTNSRMQ